LFQDIVISQEEEQVDAVADGVNKHVLEAAVLHAWVDEYGDVDDIRNNAENADNRQGFEEFNDETRLAEILNGVTSTCCVDWRAQVFKFEFEICYFEYIVHLNSVFDFFFGFPQH